MRGPVVRQLCVGRNRATNKQTLDDKFHGFFHTTFFFALLIYHLSEVSRHDWSLFFELISAGANI